MLTHVQIRNYRSFVSAEVDLAPLTLVLGANGAGKTNFLRAFVDCGVELRNGLGSGPQSNSRSGEFTRHANSTGAIQPVIVFQAGAKVIECRKSGLPSKATRGSIELFRLNPEKISAAEIVVADSFVTPDGAGTTQTLEALKNGDHEALFDAAESALKSYVPEIEKLSFTTVEQGKKQLQVRERGLTQPVPADQLSEGTRLIIALLAIIYQPVKPPIICLEDIDRGMHPRVFEQMVQLMGRIARETGVQIIATTHNPYLVDCFQDEPEAVVIVEKKDGASTLDTLANKLKTIDYARTDAADLPLGNLWFSGFVGGVPEFLTGRRK